MEYFYLHAHHRSYPHFLAVEFGLGVEDIEIEHHLDAGEVFAEVGGEAVVVAYSLGIVGDGINALLAGYIDGAGVMELLGDDSEFALGEYGFGPDNGVEGAEASIVECDVFLSDTAGHEVALHFHGFVVFHGAVVAAGYDFLDFAFSVELYGGVEAVFVVEVDATAGYVFGGTEQKSYFVSWELRGFAEHIVLCGPIDKYVCAYRDNHCGKKGFPKQGEGCFEYSLYSPVDSHTEIPSYLAMRWRYSSGKGMGRPSELAASTYTMTVSLETTGLVSGPSTMDSSLMELSPRRAVRVLTLYLSAKRSEE